jgi:hypothetical protein
LCLLSGFLIAFRPASLGPGAGLGLGTLLREVVRGESLEAERGEVLGQGAAHRKILRAVAEGELPLPEAAAALRAHLEACGQAPRVLAHYPGRTDEERYCRALLDHVRKHLAGARQSPGVVLRLEAELDVYLSGLAATPGRGPVAADHTPAGAGTRC